MNHKSHEERYLLLKKILAQQSIKYYVYKSQRKWKYSYISNEVVTHILQSGLQ